MAVAENCLELQDLDVSGLMLPDERHVTNASIIAVASQCPRLKGMDLSDCGLVPAGIAAAAEHCRQLEYASLCGTVASQEAMLSKSNVVRDDGIIELAQNSSQLEHLSIHECPGVTDARMTAIALLCPGLRYLELRECDNMTDASMNVVSKHCTRLEVFSVKSRVGKVTGLERADDDSLVLRPAAASHIVRCQVGVGGLGGG
eukprot:jgi/Mesvir1/15659/Mv03263-RA.1